MFTVMLFQRDIYLDIHGGEIPGAKLVKYFEIKVKELQKNKYWEVFHMLKV